MAIFHASVKIISRSSGKSAIGASAYRSGEKLNNENDGIQHDYTKKQGVEYKEILTPDNAPEWANDREKLWNEVEKIEKSKNSQLAREVEVALPKELNREQQIKLVKDYVQDNFVNKGMVADIAIHDKKDGNPHSHIMLTVRPFDENGNWGAKSKKEYILDSKGEKIKLKSGEFKSRKINTVDWNDRGNVDKWRESWANHTNKALEKANIKDRVDHRSYKEQDINKIPTKHEGPIVREMEKRGKETEIGNINREIAEQNKLLNLIDRQLKIYERKIGATKDGQFRDNGTENRNNGDEGGNITHPSNNEKERCEINRESGCIEREPLQEYRKNEFNSKRLEGRDDGSQEFQLQQGGSSIQRDSKSERIASENIKRSEPINIRGEKHQETRLEGESQNLCNGSGNIISSNTDDNRDLSSGDILSEIVDSLQKHIKIAVNKEIAEAEREKLRQERIARSREEDRGMERERERGR